MNELQKAIINKVEELGWSTPMFDPFLFSAEQMMELFAGCLAGIDVSEYAREDLTKDEMESIRLHMCERAGYALSEEDIDVLQSISPENILMKSMLEEVTCFMSDTIESTKALKISLDALDEVTAIEVSDKMRKLITIEYLAEGRALITSGSNRFIYRVSETENYKIFRNIGLTSLKLRKEADK